MQIVGNMFGKNFKILIDSGPTEIFISTSIIGDMPKVLEFMIEGWIVEYGSG